HSPIAPDIDQLRAGDRDRGETGLLVALADSELTLLRLEEEAEPVVVELGDRERSSLEEDPGLRVAQPEARSVGHMVEDDRALPGPGDGELAPERGGDEVE